MTEVQKNPQDSPLRMSDELDQNEEFVDFSSWFTGSQ